MREKPRIDPANIVLGFGMLVIYAAIIWLWLLPDTTVAAWLNRDEPVVLARGVGIEECQRFCGSAPVLACGTSGVVCGEPKL